MQTFQPNAITTKMSRLEKRFPWTRTGSSQGQSSQGQARVKPDEIGTVIYSDIHTYLFVHQVLSMVDDWQHFVEASWTTFFEESKVVLESLGILNNATRIYNIDESWSGPNDEQKRQKVVAVKEAEGCSCERGRRL